MEILLDRAPDGDAESPRLGTARDQPQPLATTSGAESGPTEPTETELERGILEAVWLGLGDVASTLSKRLERRRSAKDNVVTLAVRRKG